MRIEKDFPFDICENCNEFIMDVEEKVLFFGMEGSERVLIVRCKHSGKCKRLIKNLERNEDKIHEN